MKARTISTRRRVVLALLTFAVCVSGEGTAMADDPVIPTVDPVKTVYDTLLSVTNVTATGISPTQIFVSWNNTGVIGNTFRVEQSFDQFGPFSTMQVVPCNAGQGTTLCSTSYITGPPSDPTPRWIRVTPMFALNNTGTGLDGQVLLEGSPSPADPAILAPPPPTNLKCNGGGPTSTSCFNVADVELTWQDNSDEAEFWIMRAPNSAQPCRAKPWGHTPYAVLPADTTSFSEHIPLFNAVFFYKVVAVRVQAIVKVVGDVQQVVTERSYSDAVNPECIKVLTPPKAPPTAPTGLTGTLIPPNIVRLTWTDLEPNPLAQYIEEDGFLIEFGGNSSAYELLTSVPQHPGQGTVTYDDTIPSDFTRCYRVRAYRHGPAYSQFTNSVCIGAIPKPPTNLEARAITNARVDLTWTDNSNTETEFRIQRCTGICTPASSWSQIDTVPADQTTYSDTSTVASTTYSYRVVAANSSGPSTPSNIAIVTTPVEPVRNPTALTAVARSSHSIELEWTDESLDETGFLVEYHDAYSDWAPLVSVGARAGSGTRVIYLDEDGLGANQTRWYRVRARKGTKVSDPSNVAFATTLSAQAPNGIPTDFAGAVHDNVSIDLSWQAAHITNEDYFQIEYIGQPNKDCGAAVDLDDSTPRSAFKGKARVDRNLSSTRVGGLIPHTAYYFRIYAVNRDGESGPGSLASNPSLHTLGCLMTKGPALPVWEDPDKDGTVDAMRCDVTINMPRTGDPDLVVQRARIIVNGVVSGGIASSKILYLDAADDLADNRFAITGNSWRVNFTFREGVVYRLIATAYGVGPNHYHSADATRYDLKVLADCPVNVDWDSDNEPWDD